MAKRIPLANIYINNQSKEKITEALKAEVQLKPIRFPQELGEEHPFDFKQAEDAAKQVGLVGAAIDKHLDFIISPGFYVTSDDIDAEELINKFIEDTSFPILAREWIKEALMKGNGYLELSINGKEVEMKLINANQMYVKRDKKAKLLGYNQYVGGFNKFDIRKVIEFNVDEIAHLALNLFGDDAYGMGIVYPALKTADNLLSADSSFHMLMERKANAPIHAKIGLPEQPVKAADVNAFGQKLEYLNNMHEWATDHLVEFKVIDFGNFGDKFNVILEYDKEVLFMSFQVPAVMMGSGYQNEGIASSQVEGFDRRIKALQAKIEKVIEERIFRPILEANGIESKVEIVWGLPSDDKLNSRLEKLTALSSSVSISPELRAMVEKEIAKTLLLDEEDIDLLMDPAEARAQAESDMKMQAQVAMSGKEEKPKPRTKELMEAWTEESVTKDYTITEWVSFDYMTYKQDVISFLDRYDFNQLKATSAKERGLGLLNEKQVEQLRNILKNGVQENKTINKITDDLRALRLKNRYIIQDGEKRLVMTPAQRRRNIARSETVRAVSEGTLNNYEIKNIENVRFLATISPRTCQICLGLNGTVYKIAEARGIIPVHSNCRCAWIAASSVAQ